MPVDEGKTSSGLQPNISRGCGAGGARGIEAGLPAAQLALPALMATTRTRPPVARRFSLSMMSGAAVTRLAVKAAAALAGSSATIRAKSGAAALLEAGLGGAETKAAGNEELGGFGHVGVDPFNLTGSDSLNSWAQAGWERVNESDYD